MSTKKHNYTIYEGSFLTQLPAYDQSVNILRFKDPDDAEYSIMVNRMFLKEDQTPDSYCEELMDFMKNTIPAFQVEGKQLKHEIGPARLPVVQIANSYLQDGKPTKQVQSFVSLPLHPVINPHGRNLIIFTLVTENDFSEYQRKHYVQVINSFTPEPSPDLVNI